VAGVAGGLLDQVQQHPAQVDPLPVPPLHHGELFQALRARHDLAAPGAGVGVPAAQ
jgi:hypothetical protein